MESSSLYCSSGSLLRQHMKNSNHVEGVEELVDIAFSVEAVQTIALVDPKSIDLKRSRVQYKRGRERKY
eukprot:15365891-Ditylum_brightwellii.AAC.1